MVLLNVNMETERGVHEEAVGLYTIPLFKNNIYITRALITFTHLWISFLTPQSGDFTCACDNPGVVCRSSTTGSVVDGGGSRCFFCFFLGQAGFDHKSDR